SLNHFYRLVWSDSTQSYVAVSENTASRGKRTALMSVLALALMAPIATAFADPEVLEVSNNDSHTVAVTDAYDLVFIYGAKKPEPDSDGSVYAGDFVNDGNLGSEDGTEKWVVVVNGSLNGTIVNRNKIAWSGEGSATGIAVKDKAGENAHISNELNRSEERRV